MKTKQFFANAASKALALAATVMMMSMAFSACSSDNDDPKPDPEPELKANTVTFDGVEKPVLSAEYRNEGGGNYYLYLNLNADGSEYIILAVNQSLHITGTPVKLTQKQNYSWSWEVSYVTSEGKYPFYASGKLTETELPVFTTGTLTVSGSPIGTINIKLVNGRVKGEDGKEHTFPASYSGTMKEFQS